MVVLSIPFLHCFILFHIFQEAEEGAETAIDPGGPVDPSTPPTTQTIDAEAGGQAVVTEAEGEAPAANAQQEVEEISVRRLSLQAAGGVAEEQEGEETRPQEEAGSADSEQVTTETDGEEGKKKKS